MKLFHNEKFRDHCAFICLELECLVPECVFCKIDNQIEEVEEDMELLNMEDE